MPFLPAKIQPMDLKSTTRADPARRVPSRLRRLFVPRAAAGEKEKDDTGGRADVEPNSVCLDRMVLSFIEESNESNKPLRSRCNCFNGNYDESSDEELDLQYADAAPVPPTVVASGDALEIVKGLVPCASAPERNLLADVSKILEKNKNSKFSKSDCRKIVTDGLKSLGYDAAICKSRWEKTPSFPAGDHEYVDVILTSGPRLIVEVDFRSEFEIARPTKSYRAMLHSLPAIYVGSGDRLGRIVTLISDGARQSLRKKGLHFPPWRKSEYMKSKWLAPHQRETTMDGADSTACPITAVNFSGEFELRFEEKITVVVSPWRPAKPKPKLVTGLASVL